MIVLGQAESACRIRDFWEWDLRWCKLVSWGLEKKVLLRRWLKELWIRHKKMGGEGGLLSRTLQGLSSFLLSYAEINMSIGEFYSSNNQDFCIIVSWWIIAYKFPAFILKLSCLLFYFVLALHPLLERTTSLHASIYGGFFEKTSMVFQWKIQS